MLAAVAAPAMRRVLARPCAQAVFTRAFAQPRPRAPEVVVASVSEEDLSSLAESSVLHQANIRVQANSGGSGGGSSSSSSRGLGPGDSRGAADSGKSVPGGQHKGELPKGVTLQSTATRDAMEDIKRFAVIPPTPMRLQSLIELQDIQQCASLLQRELPIRFANRVVSLDALPYIDEVPELSEVREKFVQSFIDVQSAAERGVGVDQFTRVISDLKETHKNCVPILTDGMRELKQIRMERDNMSQVDATQWVDTTLNRFFLGRIGTSMLTSQYMALSDSRGRSGIVDRGCDPCKLCLRAGHGVARLARKEFNKDSVPEVEVSFHGLKAARTLPLISSYLLYILVEILKNSFRAVCESHEASGGTTRPEPIVIRVSSDEEQVVLQIFDRGGGIPFEHQAHIWSYQYSSKQKASGNCDPTPLAGFGVGLPLSKLYAEYLGGSLHLMSMPNWGTHTFLFLSRCGRRKEALPTYVDWLQRQRLREELQSLETRKRQAAEVEDYAEALRLRGLASETRAELERLEHRPL